MNAKIGLLVVTALAIAAVVAVSPYFTPTRTAGDTAGYGASGDAATGSPAGGLVNTSSKVRVSAQWADAERPATVRVTLNIAKGWHVNANPASLGFLIPTEVTAKLEDRPLAVSPAYPRGRSSDITLEDTEIDVYDDGAVIALTLPPESRERLHSGGALDILVKAQSCSEDGTCLAPSVLKTTLAGRSA